MSKVVSVAVAVVVCLVASSGVAQRKKPPVKKKHPPAAAPARPAPAPPPPAAAPEPAPAVPPRPAPKPKRVTTVVVETTAEPIEKDKVEKKKHRPVDENTAMILLDGGPELGMRNFRYNQAIVGNLRSYSNNAVAMGSIGVQAYPFATSGTPILRDIGLVGRFGSSLSFNSTTRAGDQTAKGTWMRYSIGARGRIHTSDEPGAVLVGIEATFGDSKFNFTGADAIVAEVPSVDYKYLRLGADVRVPSGGFALLAGAGYRQILSSGAYGEKFPHATLAGVDGHVGGAYKVASFLDVRATAEYVRVFSSINPRVGEPFVAGGALDQYFIFQAGVCAFF